MTGFPPPDNRSAITIVVAKAPLPHLVKTRLCPPLTPEDAASLQQAFLLDTLAKIEGQAGVFCPEGHHETLRRLVPPSCAVVAQHSTGLGSGLAEAVRLAFEAGYGRVVLLDSDTPNLPGTCVFSAVQLLERLDAVLGPCEDGGYYLIGLSGPHLGLFSDISWSTPEVLSETQAAAARLGLKTALLPVWYDVDEVSNLRRLAGDLRKQPGCAPRTAAFLRTAQWIGI